MNVYISTNLNHSIGGWTFFTEHEQGITCKWGSVENQNNKNYIDILSTYKVCEQYENIHINLYTDSSFILNGVKNLCESWKNNNWKTKNGKNIKYEDMWKVIYNKADIGELVFVENINNKKVKSMANELAVNASFNNVLNFDGME